MIMSMSAIIYVVTVAAVSGIVLILLSVRQHIRETRALAAKIIVPAKGAASTTIHHVAARELPEPVERYFHNVFSGHQPAFHCARFEQKGELKIGPKSRNWSAFSATALVSHKPVAFLWDAKVKLGPLLHVRVRDSFIEGHGAGQVSFMSAITLADARDQPELNSGSLFRYLAEAVWHPAALLPDSGVTWEPVDAHRAVARLSLNGMSVALEFRFNFRGEITGFYTDDRFGKFAQGYVRHPWEGRLGCYQVCHGIKIPAYGEVGWHLPDGWWLCWKGRIVSAEQNPVLTGVA